MNRPEIVAGVCFALSALAGVALAILYILGGQPQIEGALLFVALGGLGLGLILWGRDLMPKEQMVEERRIGPSPGPEREAAEEALARGGEMGRRRFLARLLAAAAGALGLAALFPIRSLGPSPGAALYRTRWRPGSRVVDDDGLPVAADSLVVGSVITAFPEGFVGSADSQVLVIRVAQGLLRLPPDRLARAPGGLVAFSKVCTHAGCPVGLYRAATHQLLCPCHQSTFDVLQGARPTFGPAPRPLPQLPLAVDEEGFLIATGDFTEPVGPSFWNRRPG